MSPMDQEYLNQLAWEYVLKQSANINDPELEKINLMMIGGFGVFETNEAINAMRMAAKLMGVNPTTQMRWYHGITVRNPRNILSGHSS